MARGLNKVMLIGRLGSDPDVRYTQDGTPVANFSLATDYSVKRGDRWETETEWHKVVAWRKLAEICNEYLSKGRLVYVEGSLRTRSWEDRDGNKRWTTEVISRDIQMLDSKASASAESGTEAEAGADSNPPEPPIEDDDIPF